MEVLGTLMPCLAYKAPQQTSGGRHPSRQNEKKCTIASRRCIHYKHPDFNKSGPWMQSEIAKKHKAVGRRWIHADKRLLNGKVVSRSKDDKAVTPHFASFNNNTTANLDEFNTTKKCYKKYLTII